MGSAGQGWSEADSGLQDKAHSLALLECALAVKLRFSGGMRPKSDVFGREGF